MAKRISLTVITTKGRRDVNVDVQSLLLAGYTGRDLEEVKKHIEELRKIGVPAPKKTPVVYRVSPELLTNEEEIAVKSETTSGEIEYVLLSVDEEETYVTVGSDHTDREIEKIDIQKAKEACPKVTAKEAWLYDEVRDHWDDIILRANVLKDGVKTTYQERTFGALLNAENLLDAVGVKRKGIALFSGTIPLKQKKLIYSDEFEMEIYDPRLDRKICHRYRVKRML